MGKRRKSRGRQRVGKVSYYFHHGAWWVYYIDRREGNAPIRRQAAKSEGEAAIIAAQINAQLAASAPTLYSFTAVGVAELQRQFIDYHENVARSSLATVCRYRTATRHLVNYSTQGGANTPAHQVDAEGFLRYLRNVRVAPNGHSNTVKRPLRDKGVRFVLETCRSMYGYAAKKRMLPPYAENPFAGLGGKRFAIEDAKRIFIYSNTTELTFFRAAGDWAFPVHFFLAKTGVRPGEAVHLLIEEVDLDAGWMEIRNKRDLGWRIKTGRERRVPLIDEVVSVLRRVIGSRTAGPVFVRQKFEVATPPLANSSYDRLVVAATRRIAAAELDANAALTRDQVSRIHRSVWRDAGMLRCDAIRNSFIDINNDNGLPAATCPKSWRHTFATLLQDANVDPLIRQVTLGHAPTTSQEGALGMTSLYTHTRPETQKREIERALRLWPETLELGRRWSNGGAQ